MKALPFVLSVIATVVAVLALAATLSSRDGDVAELRARVAELERGARAAPAKPGAPGAAEGAERPRRTRRNRSPAPSDPPVEAEPVVPVVRPAVSPATAGDAAAGNATGSAQSFLTGWVRSFETQPKGSDFFRLAVEAYAPDLVADLRGYLADARQPPALRLWVAKILSAPRFSDDPYAIDALVDALQTSPTGDLAKAVIDGIAGGGGPRHAVRLEALVPTTTDTTARMALIKGVAATAGQHANAALLRLFGREQHEGVRAAIVASINPLDETSGLQLIRRAASDDHYPVRNRGAERLGVFRSDDARALLDEWLAWEKEHAVRARLSAARAQQDEIPSYDVRRVLGPPDVPTPGADHVNAWCPAQENAGTEWLELTYAKAVDATVVRVYEVYTGGAVARVDVRSPGGSWRVGWEGTSDLHGGGTFEARLSSPGVAVNAVRVTLDTGRHKGWHEIDAVELVGPDGSAFATDATASSTWGQ